MELKVGMYVRTKNGIGKVDSTEVFLEKYFQFHLDSNKGRIHNVTTNTYWNSDDDIIGEPSFNIIDLIEVGDYVNGYRVAYTMKSLLGFEEGQDGDWYMSNENIKSIVTKEQFSSMEYKVNNEYRNI